MTNQTMRDDKFAGLGLTFDDVLLIPGKSDVIPAEVSLATRLAGPRRAPPRG